MKIYRLIKLINYLLKFFNLVIYVKSPNFHYVDDFYGKNYHKMNQFYKNELFLNIASEVIDRKLTLLYFDRLFVIFNCLKNIINITDKKKRKLVFVEVGAYKGGSSYFIASVLNKLTGGKTENIQIYSIDTFDGHSDIDLIPNLEPRHADRDYLKTQFSKL